MGIVDWEPRALPSEARCRVWADNSGVFLASDPTGGVKLMPSPGDAREYAFAQCFATEGVRVRPWKNCEPVPWSEFFAATHPPIPEGWEAVGAWHPIGTVKTSGRVFEGYDAFVVEIRPMVPEGWEAVGEWYEFVADSDVTFGTSGAIRFYDDFMLQDRRRHAAGERSWSVAVRPLPTAPFRAVDVDVTFADVPTGVSVQIARNREGVACIRVLRDGRQVGLTWETEDGVWLAEDERLKSGLCQGFPAAIVALTGRRE